ncbi:H-type lectin domain-containing protein [Streptomyces sp. NBC_01500]|uniref:H-type lectin domain-containing protein n=1 Tax=Streptomyces sp. NBC_01500 TaxID=2903886 RepID=UPI00338FFB74
MSGLDALLNASIDAVKKSGALENNAFMATVSVVNSNGTVDVIRAGDTFPSVRVLSGYLNPAVGDSVELLRSAGGWVCVGQIMTGNAPRIQSGTYSQTATTAGVWSSNMTVTFPKPFASIPVVVITPNAGGPGEATTNGIQVQCTSVSATSMAARHLRGNTGSSTFGWVATTF